MIRILSLTPTKSEKKVKVELSDGNRCVLDSDTAVLYRLKEDQAFEESAWEEICAESRLRLAKERAFNLLEYRARSQGELFSRLCEKTDAETASAVVEKMCELGLVDDRQLRRDKVENLLFTKKYGLKRVVYDLVPKGFDKDEILEVAEELSYDPFDVLCEWIPSHFPEVLSEETDEKEFQRVIAALMRRGFSYEEIKRALRACCE